MRLGKSDAIRRSANPEKGDFGISATFRKRDLSGPTKPLLTSQEHLYYRPAVRYKPTWSNEVRERSQEASNVIGKPGLCTFLLLCSAMAAMGQSKQENVNKCMSADPDTRIAGCTALIQTHQDTA